MFRKLLPLTALAVIPISLYALSVDFGPFHFNMGGGREMPLEERTIEDPFCRAINNRDLVELFVEIDTARKEEDKETVERLIIEPYALGYNKDGALVLRGYHIKEFALPENTKGDEKDFSGSGFVGGVFTVFKGEDRLADVQIHKIRDIKVLSNTDFKIRSKEEMGDQSDIAKTICVVE